MSYNVKFHESENLTDELLRLGDDLVEPGDTLGGDDDDPLCTDDCCEEERNERCSEGLSQRARMRLRAKVRSSRSMSLKTMAREYIWLWDVRHGVSTREIAIRERVSLSRVRFGVARARGQERTCPEEAAVRPPRLIPLFPLGPLTPQSACRHHGPIEPGSLFCCVVCHCTGIDDHPAFVRDPLTDPAPEPKPAPEPEKTKHETRKLRRQRVFGTTSPISAS